jgi:hypothetical protein
MRYVVIAILVYLVYLFIKRFLRNLSAASKTRNDNTGKQNNNTSQKRSYDVNMIEDAEYREVKKD